MARLGIIVPIYNTGTLLKGCLDSIRNQTFMDWECILVDDHSTDQKTVGIMKEALNDPRFKLLTNDVNSGVSYSRNKGIMFCQSEFVTFVDHDDSVEPECYERALRKFKEGIDWVGFGQKRCTDKDSWVKKEDASAVSGEYELTVSPRSLFVWNKIYRTKIIKDNFITFLSERPGVSIVGEDNCFNLLYSIYGSHGYYLSDLLYSHYYHSDSLCKKRDMDKNKQFNQLTSFLLLRNELARRGKLDKVMRIIDRRIMLHLKRVEKIIENER